MVGIFADELALQVEELHVVDTVGDDPDVRALHVLARHVLLVVDLEEFGGLALQLGVLVELVADEFVQFAQLLSHRRVPVVFHGVVCPTRRGHPLDVPSWKVFCDFGPLVAVLLLQCVDQFFLLRRPVLLGHCGVQRVEPSIATLLGCAGDSRAVLERAGDHRPVPDAVGVDVLREEAIFLLTPGTTGFRHRIILDGNFFDVVHLKLQGVTRMKDETVEDGSGSGGEGPSGAGRWGTIGALLELGETNTKNDTKSIDTARS